MDLFLMVNVLDLISTVKFLHDSLLWDQYRSSPFSSHPPFVFLVFFLFSSSSFLFFVFFFSFFFLFLFLSLLLRSVSDPPSHPHWNLPQAKCHSLTIFFTHCSTICSRQISFFVEFEHIKCTIKGNPSLFMSNQVWSLKRAGDLKSTQSHSVHFQAWGPLCAC